RAIARAQDARDAIVARVLRHAQREWPDRWTEVVPMPFRFATWVGYDMDGRTDIGWVQSLRFRLSEKAERLARYVASLEAIDAGQPTGCGLTTRTGGCRWHRRSKRSNARRRKPGASARSR